MLMYDDQSQPLWTPLRAPFEVTDTVYPYGQAETDRVEICGNDTPRPILLNKGQSANHHRKTPATKQEAWPIG